MRKPLENKNKVMSRKKIRYNLTKTYHLVIQNTERKYLNLNCREKLFGIGYVMVNSILVALGETGTL